jgi:hypothetical protein
VPCVTARTSPARAQEEDIRALCGTPTASRKIQNTLRRGIEVVFAVGTIESV